MGNFFSDNTVFKVFMLLGFLAFLGNIINQLWIIFKYIILIITNTYSKISNRKWGEKYHIKLNEQTYTLLSSFMYLWFCFLILIIPPVPQVKVWLIFAYFIFAFLSSNLLACSVIKKMIDNKDFTGVYFGTDTLSRKDILIKYSLWAGIPYIIYIIVWLKISSIYPV